VATIETPTSPQSPATTEGGVAQSATTGPISIPVETAPPAESAAAEAATPPTESAAVAPGPPVATDAAPAAASSTANLPPEPVTTPDASAATPSATAPPLADAPSADAAATVAANPPTAPPALPGTDSELVVEPGAPQGPQELGTYLSGKTVLLHFDPSKGGWFRVQPRSAVVAGERLLSLPEFRPQILLASGMTLDMSGGTQAVLTAGDANSPAGQNGGGAVPLIEVLYGRIVLINTSNSDSQVRIKAGNNIGTAALGKNATLAVEVDRAYVPGNDPRTTPAPVIATMYAPNGNLTWRDASGEIVVEKPSRWTVAEGAPAAVVADSAPPEWIDREPVVHLSEQRYGAPVIETTLVSDKPVDFQLLELFKGRDRREVKSLVARASMHVGLFAPFIDALRDPEQRMPTWRSHIETLRSAMAQSPESAELVFQALVDQRGRPAATDLYEMLCGYSAEQIGTTPEEIKTGAISQLIDWLEEDSLDYRVLAVHDLWEITGKQLMPNPAAQATLRKRSINRWRDQLKSNEIRPVKREVDEEAR
jgi:hypothetical protein